MEGQILTQRSLRAMQTLAEGKGWVVQCSDRH